MKEDTSLVAALVSSCRFLGKDTTAARQVPWKGLETLEDGGIDRENHTRNGNVNVLAVVVAAAISIGTIEIFEGRNGLQTDDTAAGCCIFFDGRGDRLAFLPIRAKIPRFHR